MGHPSFVTLSCSPSNPTFWKLNGSIVSPVASFFGGSFTQVGICLILSKISFKYHVSMSSLIFGSRGNCSVINSSYHTYILFILNPLPYNTMHLSWLATSYVAHFSWAYNSPRYISGYYHSYCFGKWNTCSQGGLPPIPSHEWISLSPKMAFGPIVVVGPTPTNMLQRTLTMTSHVSMMVAQEKTINEQALGNDFIPIAIETYGCLHSHFDSFFITCA